MNISRSIAVAAVACLPLLVPHKAHAIDVNISAEFTQATGNVAGDFSYSLNVQYGFIPDVAGNEAPPRSKYKSHVAAMGAGMVRYHQAAQMSLSSSDFGWLKTDGAPPTWDEAKIAAALSTSYPYGPVRMINIANWPPSMDDGTGRLKPSQYSNYAAFCAELVKILNIDLGYKIQYFEVFNELNGPYQGDMATVGQMFNQVAAAMKAVDPSIKVGGPAFSYVGGNANDLSDFYGVAGASLDFASFHTYAYYRPMPTYTDSEIFDSAACSDGMQVSQGLSCFGAGKQILIAAGYRPDLEFYMDEFNINSYYNADANQAEDPRMTSIEGAIFDALVMINGVKSGLTGVLAWNESDGPNGFGKLGNSNRFLPSPAAYVYQAFNTYLRGSEYQSTSSNPKGVVPLAILSDTSFAVAMANRARNAAGEAMAQTVKVNISGPLNLGPNTLLSVYRVSAKGPQHQKDVSYNTLHNTGYKLPADTVTILTLPISGHAAGQINVR